MKPPRPLKRHQQRAYALALRARSTHPAHELRVGLFMRPGTGKTLTAIRLVNNARFGHMPILILCRRDDFLTWELELEREGVLPEDILKIGSSTEIPRGADAGDLIANTLVCHCGATFADHRRENHPPVAMNPADRPLLYVLITWDLLRQKRVRYFVKDQKWGAKIGDELHTIKRSQAKRTQAALRSTAHVPNAIGLTGTPITNSLEDLFSQAKFILGPRSPLAQTRWEFLNRFFVQAPRDPSIQSFGQWYPQRNAKQRISALLAPHTFFIHENDAIPDLPPIIRLIKSTPLTGMERRHYNNFLNNWETELLAPDTPVETYQERTMVNLVISQLQKLRQICGGFFYRDIVQGDDDPDGGHPIATKQRETVHLRSSKLALLERLLFGDDAPFASIKTYPAIVIACAYTAEIDRIAHTIRTHVRPGAFLKYTGQLSPRERINARRRFSAKAGPRYFIAQVDMLQGMNELTRANLLIYYSNSDKVVSRDQSELRIRRIGSSQHGHKRVTYVDLVTEGTIEERQTRRRLSAQEIAREILDNLAHKRPHPITSLIPPAK
jgi:SNF2 family DNA or RNA helicase